MCICLPASHACCSFFASTPSLFCVCPICRCVHAAEENGQNAMHAPFFPRASSVPQHVRCTVISLPSDRQQPHPPELCASYAGVPDLLFRDEGLLLSLSLLLLPLADREPDGCCCCCGGGGGVASSHSGSESSLSKPATIFSKWRRVCGRDCLLRNPDQRKAFSNRRPRK